MDESVYDEYYRLEREHWWNLARKEIIITTLKKYYSALNQATVADIGSGTGSFLEEFEKMGIQAEGHDSSPSAVAYMKKSCNFKIIQKMFPDDYHSAQDKNKYDVVLLLDVIEHLDDDRKGMTTALALLKPGGILICTVPACPLMWSEYDIVMHHRRRYGKLDEICALVDPSQGEIKKLTYFSMLLFPFLFFVRYTENILFKIKKRKAVFNPHFVPKLLNLILLSVFRLENRLLKHFDLPFGSSMLAIVEKK